MEIVFFRDFLRLGLWRKAFSDVLHGFVVVGAVRFVESDEVLADLDLFYL